MMSASSNLLALESFERRIFKIQKVLDEDTIRWYHDFRLQIPQHVPDILTQFDFLNPSLQ